MKVQRRFCRCRHCGNFISFITDAGPNVVCCGEEMEALTPNTSDGAKEKHIPAAVREDNKLTVTIGSVPHPMTPEHHIEWILVAEARKTQRAMLEPTGAPSAEFIVGDGPVTVYEYCNLHGLWVTEI